MPGSANYRLHPMQIYAPSWAVEAARGAMPPPPTHTHTHTFMGHCLQEKIDTLIEQSGPRYSVIEQSHYSEKQCSKLLSYVCVVISKEI